MLKHYYEYIYVESDPEYMNETVSHLCTTRDPAPRTPAAVSITPEFAAISRFFPELYVRRSRV